MYSTHALHLDYQNNAQLVYLVYLIQFNIREYNIFKLIQQKIMLIEKNILRDNIMNFFFKSLLSLILYAKEKRYMLIAHCSSQTNLFLFI